MAMGDVGRGRMGEILSVWGCLHPGQLERALWMQREAFPGKPLGRILVDTGMVSATRVYEALCLSLGLPYSQG